MNHGFNVSGNERRLLACMLVNEHIFLNRADVSLSGDPQYKPDFGIYVNGLSQRFEVVVGEFEAPKGHCQGESDTIKIGKEMRTMINRLVTIGVEDPVVCGVLVSGGCLSTYKMELRGPKLYVMARLSKLNLIRTSDDLVMLPILVSRIAQVQVMHSMAVILRNLNSCL